MKSMRRAPSGLMSHLRAIGPEAVATALSIVVVAGLVVALASAAGKADGSAGPSSTSSAPPGTAQPTTAIPPTPVPWRTLAASMIDEHLRMVDMREELRSTLGIEAVPTSTFVRQLRAAVTALRSTARMVESLAETGLRTDIVDDLRDVSERALDAGIATLQASVQNDAAYRNGASAVIQALDPLDALLVRLAAASGLPAPSLRPPPGPGPSPSASP